MRSACAVVAFASCVFLIGGCGGSGGVPESYRVLGLESPAGPGSTAPHLALSADGGVVMSWLEPVAGGAHAVRFATLRDAGWSPANTVVEGASWFITCADVPSVTPITATDWAAHWLVKQPGGTYSYDVAIAISRDGGATWGAPLTPHDDGTRTEHGFVTLFPWGDGFGAVWLDGRNTRQDGGAASGAADGSPAGMTVRYARLGFDGTIRESGEIDDLVCDCCATDVAVATAGPVVTYRNRTTEEIRDIAVSRYADGAWQPPVILGSDNWHMPGCPVNGSTIAARGEQVVVAWYAAPRRQPRVQLARSNDGGRTFGAPVVVAEGTVSGRVDVELLADGSALVSWTARTPQAPGSGDQRQSSGRLLMRRVPPTGASGPVQVIAEGDVSRGGGFPQMIGGRAGLVWAWTQPGAPSRVLTAWSPAG